MPVAKKPKQGRAGSASNSTSSTSQSGVSASSASPASKAATATSNAGVEDCPIPGQRPVKCAVCDQNVRDGKDQALFCEGQCQSWFHRYCAGVSLAQFAVLSSSSEPFHCTGCFQKSCTSEMAVLKDTISSLREEVTQLHTALEEVRKNCPCTPMPSQYPSADDENWKVVQRGDRGGRGRGRGRQGRGLRVGRVGSGVESREPRTSGGEVMEGSGRGGCSVQPGGASGEGPSTAQSSNVSDGKSSRDSLKQKSSEKIRVQGARRVWGTMKVTTASSLKHAISKFCPASSLQVKRKTVNDHSGQVKRWWFVIHAPEDILLDLDSTWEQLQLQTGWKLEPCFRPSQLTVASNCIMPQLQVDGQCSMVEPTPSTSVSEPNACDSDDQTSYPPSSESTPFLET